MGLFGHRRRHRVWEGESHHSFYKVAKTHQGLLGRYWAAFLILEFKCKRDTSGSQELTGCARATVTAGVSKANPVPCKQPRLTGNNGIMSLSLPLQDSLRNNVIWYQNNNPLSPHFAFSSTRTTWAQSIMRDWWGHQVKFRWKSLPDLTSALLS